jgi:hypothetical protein
VSRSNVHSVNWSAQNDNTILHLVAQKDFTDLVKNVYKIDVSVLFATNKVRERKLLVGSFTGAWIRIRAE